MDVADRIGGPGAVGDEPDPAGRETTADVTRYLAAAAYLDERFRAEVIVQTLWEQYRFIAPSYGVNIGCVVRHCIASRRLSRRRDFILAALLVVGLWALRLPLLFEVGIFVGALLVATALNSRKTKLRWRVVLSIATYIGITAFALHPLSLLTALAAWLVVAADAYERRYRVVARHMNADDFRAEAPAYGRERPAQRASDERRIAHLARHQDGNVVVYSGYSPFKGSGFRMRRWSWSFAVDVTEAPGDGDRSNPVASIETNDVYAHVMGAMKGLDIEGRSVTERFYVNGKYAGRDRDLFFHEKGRYERFRKLRTTIDDVAALEAKPEEMVRRYVDIKVASWQSELILSAFLRFSRTADYLFIEVSYYVLPPLKPRYYNINGLNPRPTPHELFRLAVDSLTKMPLLWLRSPVRVEKWLTRPLARARWEQVVAQAIRENRRFDYGARGSIRESGSDDDFAKYFQEVDIERLHKIIDRHLLTSIRKFFEGKGVDISELERSIRVIINKGIWISGNQSGNIAVDHSQIDIDYSGEADGAGSS